MPLRRSLKCQLINPFSLRPRFRLLQHRQLLFVSLPMVSASPLREWHSQQFQLPGMQASVVPVKWFQLCHLLKQQPMLLCRLNPSRLHPPSLFQIQETALPPRLYLSRPLFPTSSWSSFWLPCRVLAVRSNGGGHRCVASDHGREGYSCIQRHQKAKTSCWWSIYAEVRPTREYVQHFQILTSQTKNTSDLNEIIRICAMNSSPPSWYLTTS